MAENESDSQEKTEEPTPRRRDQAREKGQIVTSKEMFVFANLAMATMVLILGQNFLPDIAGIWASYLVIDAGQDLHAHMLAQLGRMLVHIIGMTLLLGIPLIIVIILSQAAIGGLNFAPGAMGFKFEKLNPLKGIGRMFSARALVELSKALLKLLLLGGLAILVLYPQIPKYEKIVFANVGDGVRLLGVGLMQLLGALLLGLLVIGAIDLVWQIFSMNKKLRMSRQELKDESKETEGSPEVKGRIRRLQMEASQQAAGRRKALEDVPNATAVITNPIHFAVALRYVPEEMRAPKILAMGRGVLAHQIIEKANDAKITVTQQPLLARALYYTGEIGEEISEQLYAAVAIILAHVYRLEHGEYPDTPQIELPQNLRLDAMGRPIKESETDERL